MTLTHTPPTTCVFMEFFPPTAIGSQPRQGSVQVPVRLPASRRWGGVLLHCFKMKLRSLPGLQFFLRIFPSSLAVGDTACVYFFCHPLLALRSLAKTVNGKFRRERNDHRYLYKASLKNMKTSIRRFETTFQFFPLVSLGTRNFLSFFSSNVGFGVLAQTKVRCNFRCGFQFCGSGMGLPRPGLTTFAVGDIVWA